MDQTQNYEATRHDYKASLLKIKNMSNKYFLSLLKSLIEL